MSDTQFAVTPEQYAGLTPAGQQQLESALTKAGATQEYLASLKGSAKPAASGKSAPEQLVQPFLDGKPASDPKFSPAPTAAGHIPIEQRVAAFQKLREAGVADATLQKAAAEEGIAWSEIVKDASAPVQNQVTLQQANEKLAQTSGPFAASTDPNDFSFQFEARHIEGLDPSEVADIDGTFRNAFHEATIPVSMAQSVFSEAMTAANTYHEMPDEQAKLRYAEEGQRLRRLGNIEQIVADHNVAWERLPKDFRDFAMEQRLFHTAEAFMALSRTGQMMRLRDSKKGK